MGICEVFFLVPLVTFPVAMLLHLPGLMLISFEFFEPFWATGFIYHLLVQRAGGSCRVLYLSHVISDSILNLSSFPHVVRRLYGYISPWILVTLLLPTSNLTFRPAQEPIAICHRRWQEPTPTWSAACREAGLTYSTVVLATNALQLSESIVAMCGVERSRQEIVKEGPSGSH